jgi:hypothetical protein
METDTTTATDIGAIKKRRLNMHISSDWHTASIRMAGRIFRDYRQRVTVASLRKCTRSA